MIHKKHSLINRKGLADYFRNHIHTGGIIVCPSRKFVYMKSAKTAGTSILRGVLENQIADVIHQKDHPEDFESWLQHITDRDLEDYFIFAVARNPWDRVVSITRYLELPLSDFLQNYQGYIQEEKIRSHSLPISVYTHNQKDRFVDVVCRFETLQSDMNLVFDEIGIPRQRLPILNVSNHRHYSDYFTELDIGLVEDIYQEDIRNFGYMFQRKEKQSVKSFLREFFSVFENKS